MRIRYRVCSAVFGAKTINLTLKYIQLAEALFHDVSNFIVKTAMTHEEAPALLEVGFHKADEGNLDDLLNNLLLNGCKIPSLYMGLRLPRPPE